MKTTAILAATVAAFLITSGPTLAAEPQQTQTQTQTQTKAKRCYRQYHKVPHLTRVRCPKPHMQKPSEPTKPAPAQQ